MTEPFSITLREEPRRVVAEIAGRIDLMTVRAFDKASARLSPPPPGYETVISLGGIERLDTAGAISIERLSRRWGDGTRIDGLESRYEPLMKAVVRRDVAEGPLSHPNAVLVLICRLGEGALEVLAQARDMVAFFGLLVISFARILVRPRRLRVTSVVHHLQATGLDAVPIIALLMLLIGVVLTFQAADQLKRFGAEVFVVNLLGVSILREMGVLLPAIMVAGRSGSAFAAQIGTMKVTQEIDAMRTMGLDPMEFLVLPRVIALMIAMPLLTILADVAGLVGGGLMAWMELGITPTLFFEQLNQAVTLNTFLAGLIKAPVFAAVIAMVGCYEGMRVSGSAESVGRRTTQAVVESIFLVIALDAVFSVLFTKIGI